MFEHKWRYGFIFLLGGYSYLNTVLTKVYEFYPIKGDWYWIAFVMIVATLLIWEGNRFLARKVLPRKTDSIVKKLLSFFLLSFPLAFLAAVIPTLAVAFTVMDYTWEEVFLPLQLIVAFCFRVNLFLHSIHSIVFFWKRFQRQEAETAELKRISFQAQMQSLRNQINPHFLFNSLNVLSTLIMKSPQVANEFIEEFSKVYRYVLKNYEKELIPLKEEMEFIRSYLFLLKKRFGESIQVDININGNCEKYWLVPVALQMLIENAIKHNIVSQKKPLGIHIFIEKGQWLVVQNTLQKKEAAEIDSTQLGLKNIHKRYEFINHHGIEVSQQTDVFTVKIPIIEIESA